MAQTTLTEETETPSAAEEADESDEATTVSELFGETESKLGDTTTAAGTDFLAEAPFSSLLTAFSRDLGTSDKNIYALSWYLKNKGAKSHYKDKGGKPVKKDKYKNEETEQHAQMISGVENEGRKEETTNE